MMNRLEDLYLEAEASIRNSAYLEAKQMYEQMLTEEPTSAHVHNSLGWIYKTQLEDFEKAENHYRAAIKYEPSYPHPYINLAALLTDAERWIEAELILDASLSVAKVDKCAVHIRYGYLFELRQDFDLAIEHFKKALKFALTDERLEALKKDIARCEFKTTL
ncbi:hypothetical protein C3K47_07695 [Solitalea longa]|uniref:Uncharacterized protein n=1 Tax=Solitalea longa TaxID=2079460 RepID=A0A2S5A2X3_9SPHI|nr:tetratricopeptide repeat protein [Solitalea longa]POY36938.1 hypothetical protein C3K47_07695 [Solitalea longa]